MADQNPTYTLQQPTKGANVTAHAHVSEGTVFAALGAAAAVVYLLSEARKHVLPPTAVPTTATPIGVPSAPPISVVGAPVSLTQVGATTSSVSITWAPVEGAVEYQVWQYSPRTLLAQTTTNQATIQNLQANTHYELFVVAIGATGQSGPPSEPLLVATASTTQTPTVPSIPGGLTVVSTAPDAITLSWLETAGATYYQVKNVTTGQVTGPISGTEVTISGLTPGDTYQFELYACNSVGCSQPSSLVSATTQITQQPTAAPPAAPGQIVASAITATSVELDWQAVPGANSYTLLNAATGATLESGLTTTSVTVSGLSPATGYQFAVEACNTYGCSSASPAVSVTTASASTTTPTTSTPTTATTTTTATHPTCPATLPSSYPYRAGTTWLSMGEDPADPGHWWVCQYQDGTLVTSYDEPISQAPSFTQGTIVGGHAPPPAAPACAATYTVQPGDNLWDLALRYYGNGALWHVIYNANTQVVGSNPNYILPGEQLCIPPRGVAAGSSLLPMPYQVAAGDTLSGLARRFYGDAAKYCLIACANHIACTGPNGQGCCGNPGPCTIYIGQVITIPALT